MENLCHFVCSRGLLKSCNFHSINPKSSCNNDFNYLFEMLNSKNMFDGMSIYICSDLLKFFVNQILPKINNTFILVTGDSDMNVPMDALSKSETLILWENVYLLKWFSQNTQLQHHIKMIQLPIGLDYHTISNNSTHCWKQPGEGHLPRFQEGNIIKLRQQMNPFFERIPKIYINFSVGNDRFGQRKDAFIKIPNNLLIINQNFMHRTTTWNNITKYSFVLSPFGIGMDCHRTWEALCLGAIPILKAPHFTKMFEDLPVLIVNEWSDITESLLNNTIRDFKNKNFNYNKLTLQYWINRIKKTDFNEK